MGWWPQGAGCRDGMGGGVEWGRKEREKKAETDRGREGNSMRGGKEKEKRREGRRKRKRRYRAI